MGDVKRDRRGIESRHEIRLAVLAGKDLQCVRRPVKTCATATDDGALPVRLEMERVGISFVYFWTLKSRVKEDVSLQAFEAWIVEDL